jgi:hypothetical protein
LTYNAWRPFESGPIFREQYHLFESTVILKLKFSLQFLKAWPIRRGAFPVAFAEAIDQSFDASGDG